MKEQETKQCGDDHALPGRGLLQMGWYERFVYAVGR